MTYLQEKLKVFRKRRQEIEQLFAAIRRKTIADLYEDGTEMLLESKNTAQEFSSDELLSLQTSPVCNALVHLRAK